MCPQQGIVNELILWEGCRLLGEQTNYVAEMAGAQMMLEKVLTLLVKVLVESGEGVAAGFVPFWMGTVPIRHPLLN